MKPLSDFQQILPHLTPGSSIVLHSACAEPKFLAGQLAAHAPSLRDVRLYTLMPMSEAPYAARQTASHLSLVTFFPGKGLRQAVNEGRVEVLRPSLGSIPRLFQDRVLTADVLLLQLSPPDTEGRMSLGIAVDYMRAVLEQNPLVVVEINTSMPRTCGDTLVREDEVDFVVDSRSPPTALLAAPADPIDQRIADNVAGLIRNGAVIQTGIGALPDLVLGRLGSMRDLSLHSGVIGDALLPLLARGVVTNAGKKHFPGRCVTTMAVGTQAFYDALNENPLIEFHPSSVTHNVELLAELDGFCAINSVLQIDLSGRANAECVDGRIISTPGGLPDFARGATLAKGGISIIALRSTSKDGRRSNILPALASDAPVTVTAEHIDYVVTEHGVARLRGLGAARRAEALIAIADPGLRADLRRGATDRSKPSGCDLPLADLRGVP
jgi:4-hydroxybutyrate CoA-transferase